jgi:4-hydroxy-tetrahydrodipicolinate reductase
VQSGLEVEIASKREGDVQGIHTVIARNDAESIELRHECFSRRAFAEGAVRAAEWLSGKSGVFDFREIFEQV